MHPPEELQNGNGKAQPGRRLCACFEKFGFKRIGHSGVYALCTYDERPSLKELSVPWNFTVPMDFLKKNRRKPEKQ
jgi:hypothetical protein